MKNKKLDKGCSRCSRQLRNRGEAFWCLRNRFVFDVDVARELIADGREPVELDPDDVRYSVDRCEINEGHIAHVNPDLPGIVAHIFFPDDGTVVHGTRLIDGHHRAARCLRDNIPFYVYVLTEQESIEALTRAPEGAKPDFLVASDRLAVAAI